MTLTLRDNALTTLPLSTGVRANSTLQPRLPPERPLNSWDSSRSSRPRPSKAESPAWMESFQPACPPAAAWPKWTMMPQLPRPERSPWSSRRWDSMQSRWCGSRWMACTASPACSPLRNRLVRYLRFHTSRCPFKKLQRWLCIFLF